MTIELSEYVIDAIADAVVKKMQEPCEDVVSRQAVKEQMIKYGFLAHDMTVTEFVEDCLPSVTPQPKIGRWIEHKWAEEVDDHLISNFECSCCHTWKRDESIYCPDCGAKMEEVEE